MTRYQRATLVVRTVCFCLLVTHSGGAHAAATEPSEEAAKAKPHPSHTLQARYSSGISMPAPEGAPALLPDNLRTAGYRSPSPPEVELEEANESVTSSLRAQRSVNCAPPPPVVGDFDGDTLQDTARGYPQATNSLGEVRIQYGNGNVQVLRRGIGPLAQTDSGMYGDQFGAALASADIDGDGIEDLVVGT